MLVLCALAACADEESGRTATVSLRMLEGLTGITNSAIAKIISRLEKSTINGMPVLLVNRKKSPGMNTYTIFPRKCEIEEQSMMANKVCIERRE